MVLSTLSGPELIIIFTYYPINSVESVAIAPHLFLVLVFDVFSLSSQSGQRFINFIDLVNIPAFTFIDFFVLFLCYQ